MRVLQVLLDGVRSTCAGFPDKRRGGDVTYSMADIGLSAVSLFFMQSASFLAYQRGLEQGRKTSNCQSLFGMKAIPTDNHIWAMLDPVAPSHLQPAFDVLRALRQRGGPGAIPKARWSRADRARRHGVFLFAEARLPALPDAPARQQRDRALPCHAGCHGRGAGTCEGATSDAGLHRAPQDGAAKQDCERNAAKRWLATHAARVKDVRPIYLGDDRFACQPIAAAMTAAGGDFRLTAKPLSHKALYDFMQSAALEERTVEQKVAGKRLTYRYRWFKQAPLRDGKDTMLVDWVGVTITDANGKVTYDSAFMIAPS